jgi:hypothetical protein
MPAVSQAQQLAYWAGFFDGEGAVWLAVRQDARASHPQVQLKVAVSNTHRGIVEQLATAFPPPAGRAVASFLGGPKDKVKRRQQYKWEMSGDHAYRFLKRVLPWLVVKRDQALLAVQFYELPWRSPRVGPGGGWKVRTTENVVVDLEYARRVKELKRASGE